MFYKFYKDLLLLKEFRLSFLVMLKGLRNKHELLYLKLLLYLIIKLQHDLKVNKKLILFHFVKLMEIPT